MPPLSYPDRLLLAIRSEQAGAFHRAVERYLETAPMALSEEDRTGILQRAWWCHELAAGRLSMLVDD